VLIIVESSRTSNAEVLQARSVPRVCRAGPELPCHWNGCHGGELSLVGYRWVDVLIVAEVEARLGLLIERRETVTESAIECPLSTPFRSPGVPA
jgi:hypothetical protein